MLDTCCAWRWFPPWSLLVLVHQRILWWRWSIFCANLYITPVKKNWWEELPGLDWGLSIEKVFVAISTWGVHGDKKGTRCWEQTWCWWYLLSCFVLLAPLVRMQQIQLLVTCVALSRWTYINIVLLLHNVNLSVLVVLQCVVVNCQSRFFFQT